MITIEITEADLKKLVADYIESKVQHDVDVDKVRFFVKSKQNYKSEWEEAAFKATYTDAKL